MQNRSFIQYLHFLDFEILEYDKYTTASKSLSSENLRD